jgi:hypothetical protein
VSDVLEDWEVTVLLSADYRYGTPTSPLLDLLYAEEFGRSDPAFLRGAARDMQDLPDRRRAWLLDVADRLESAGCRSFAEVPDERFDEIAQLY